MFTFIPLAFDVLFVKDRRKGIASHFIQWILEQGKSLDCRAVYLHVISYNDAAMAMYRKNRFQEMACRQNFYHIRSVASLLWNMFCPEGMICMDCLARCPPHLPSFPGPSWLSKLQQMPKLFIDCLTSIFSFILKGATSYWFPSSYRDR